MPHLNIRWTTEKELESHKLATWCENTVSWGNWKIKIRIWILHSVLASRHLLTPGLGNKQTNKRPRSVEGVYEPKEGLWGIREGFSESIPYTEIIFCCTLLAILEPRKIGITRLYFYNSWKSHSLLELEDDLLHRSLTGSTLWKKGSVFPAINKVNGYSMMESCWF